VGAVHVSDLARAICSHSARARRTVASQGICPAASALALRDAGQGRDREHPKLPGGVLEDDSGLYSRLNELGTLSR
jgi:hypothetical protein